MGRAADRDRQQGPSGNPTLGADGVQALPGSTLPGSTLPGSTLSTRARATTHKHDLNAVSDCRPLSYLTAGPGAVLWRFWCELDTDGDGELSRAEFSTISSKLGAKWDVEAVWNDVVRESDLAEVRYVREARKAMGQHINFQGFVSVYNRLMGQERRTSRLDIKAAFEKLQTKPEGLHKEGVLKLYRRCKPALRLLPPAFDIDADWILMHQLSDDDDELETIVFVVFERWWKLRMGLSEADTPVIPEYFQYKLEELADVDERASVKHQSTSLIGLESNLSTSLKGRIRQYREYDVDAPSSVMPRHGKKLWKILRKRLNVLVTMSRDWGNASEFYGSAGSQFGDVPLPWNVRDPESRFSSAWDMLQVFFLCFVSYTVPYRAGFGVEIEIFSAWWFLDTTIDLYFIVDLVLNFFTAFYDSNGVREGRPAAIAKAYLQGWFIIDFVSCLPVQYVLLIIDSGDNAVNDDSGSDLRVIKTLRLLRLSKMLRLARIKRILAKYENLEFVQQYSGMLALMFIIAFAGHLLACFWYMIGVSAGVDVQGDIIPGWTLLEYCPKCADPTDSSYEPCESLAFQGSKEDCPSTCDWIPEGSAPHGTTAAACTRSDGCVVGCEIDPSVAMSTRYITSMYYVFNALDGNGRTDGERAFAVFGYIVMVIIDGAVAGVLSSVLISMGGTERIVNEKLAATKSWMREQRISKSEQVKALNYFRQVYRSHVMYQEADILNTMPPAMRLQFSTHLYAAHLAQIPIFRGVGASVIHALCNIVEPMIAVKSQVIYAEGSVGQEMYILITGELEITADGVRLGFLSDGAFFGETPLLDRSSEAERRRRTVTAMIECKLCFIARDSLYKILPKYPELALKLKRCSRFNKNQVNKKGKKFKMALREATSAPLPVGLPSPMSIAETWAAPPTSPPATGAGHSADFAGDNSNIGRNHPRSTTALPKLEGVTAKLEQPSEHPSELSRRVEELQEMVARMDARSAQTAKSVDAILQHLKLHAAAK